MIGGAILNRFGLSGTYYVSLGLAGQETPSGRMFAADDLKGVLDRGHELGCHTFSHCHAWDTATDAFVCSIVENRVALSNLLPGTEFKTFSYPISFPRPLSKSRIADQFSCCRGGGQTFNVGTSDLNLLSAYFLEKSRHSVQAVRDLIDRNRQARGWLIFATHDIADDPTPFGCTPEFFQDVVGCASRSGATILPVNRALEVLQSVDCGKTTTLE